MTALFSCSIEATPEIEPDAFLKMMIISGYAERFEKGDPMVVSGMSGYEKLSRLYKMGHTVSEDKVVLLIEGMRNDEDMALTRIQEYRKRIGMSQRALSEAAGVNLRTLQQYEIRDKDINKAAAEKVVALSRVLGCRPEDIME